MFKQPRPQTAGTRDHQKVEDKESPPGNIKVSLAADVGTTAEIPHPRSPVSKGRMGSKKNVAVDRFEIELQSVVRGNRAHDSTSGATLQDTTGGASLQSDLKSLLAQGQLDMERLCEHELVSQLGLHSSSFSQCVHQLAEVRAAEAYRKAVAHARQALEDEANRRRRQIEQAESELQNAVKLLGIAKPKFKAEALSSSGLDERRELLRDLGTLLARRRKEEAELREQLTRLESVIKPEDLHPSLALSAEPSIEAPLSAEKIQHLQLRVQQLQQLTRRAGGEEGDLAENRFIVHHSPTHVGNSSNVASPTGSQPPSPSSGKPRGARPTPHVELQQGRKPSKDSGRKPSKESAAGHDMQDSELSKAQSELNGAVETVNRAVVVVSNEMRNGDDEVRPPASRSSGDSSNLVRSAVKKHSTKSVSSDADSPARKSGGSESPARKAKSSGTGSFESPTIKAESSGTGSSESPARKAERSTTAGDKAKEAETMLPQMELSQGATDGSPYSSKGEEQPLAAKRSVEFMPKFSENARLKPFGEMKSDISTGSTARRRPGMMEWMRRR